MPSLPKYNVTPDSNRDTTSLYINDKYSINPDFDITAGIRYDNYSDFGDALSPTLAFVYRINPKWRIKSLYSQAYRVPSWVELTSNPNLKAETSNSYEAGVIYKDRKSSIVRFNIYRTEIYNLIIKNTPYTQALDDSHFFGAELEYLFTPSQDLDLTLFASYVEATDENDEDLADVANELLTLSGIYELDYGLTLGGLVKYIGSSKRSTTDISETRGSMSSSLITDTTLSYAFKNLTASLIIKDLFDKGTYYALPTSTLNNDFYDGGRTILVKASWEF
ncbi:MAG: TonB-dependent receptor [Sulfurimonas sp.]|nr:TonB-dependent receptor [Sulfurimonas sp.]